jgi:release factor glutamine methyltransferase
MVPFSRGALPTIEEALIWAKEQLRGGESVAIDSKVLLGECLQCTSTYLFTWPEKPLLASQWAQFQRFILQRQQGHPVAYIIGHRSFWTLDLTVNPSTLIPRPETELLVETALELLPNAPIRCCDLGTGTGAIAIALGSERPQWQLLGVDRVAEAIDLAQSNALQNQVTNVEWLCSHWFDNIPHQGFDLIVSNPPYVEANSPYLCAGDVRFEPASALTAGEDGLDDIKTIIARAPDYLVKGGILLFEHGFNQALRIQELLTARGFVGCKSYEDLNGVPRVTQGFWLKS